jgi:hypothetical protein
VGVEDADGMTEVTKAELVAAASLANEVGRPVAWVGLALGALAG